MEKLKSLTWWKWFGFSWVVYLVLDWLLYSLVWNDPHSFASVLVRSLIITFISCWFFNPKKSTKVEKTDPK